MKSFKILLNAASKVKNFVNDMETIEGEAFLSGVQYAVSARSFLGIYSLDLSRPLELKIKDWKDEYMEILKKYLA